MASPPDASGPAASDGGAASASGRPGPGGAEGISAFLGRVLDQLSLSSWLPAAMLVGNGAVLVTLGLQEEPDLAAAIQDLTGDALGLLVVLTFLLVLATIVTQAFEFEAIRLLEGYADTALPPVQFVAARRIRRHGSKRRRMHERLRFAEQAAFMQARSEMLNAPEPVDRTWLDVLEDQLFGRTGRPKPDEQVVADAQALDWSPYVPPEVLFRIDALDARACAYPVPHRLLPTRLGNVLRAAEDALPIGPGEDLEGFVLRHDHTLPPALRAEHRDYRVRLDMYCSLTLVFVVLLVLAAAVLGSRGAWWQAASACLGYAALSWLSYEAAVASARGYGSVLREIGRRVSTATDEADRAAAARASWRLSVARLTAWLHRNRV